MNEIPKWFTPEVKKIKTLAPIYLNLFLEQRGFNINDFRIRTLNTGEASACYFLARPEGSSIIKFKNTGAFAEAEALNVWSSRGVQVPKVLDVGTIKDQTNGSDMQFLQLEAICNQNNDEIALLGYEFIDANPLKASEIGKQMGVELAKMHGSSAIHAFGRFADLQGQIYSSWTEYLTNLLGKEEYQKYFFSKGITKTQLSAVSDRLTNFVFPGTGVYIHGDFGIHNILVSNKHNLGVYVIDPDPQIGNPYLDIASILFRLQISKIMYDLNPNNAEVASQYTKFTNCYQALINSYLSHSPEQYDPQKSAIHKAIALLPKMVYREKKLKMWIRDKRGDIESYQAEIYAYRLFLLNAIEELT